MQNALGNITCDNQCPAKDDIRDTMAALMRSVDQLAPLRTLQMESINCMGFTHEYPHEKDGVGLTALEDFLLSLCFCPACMAKGRAAGVDMEHVRECVRADVKKFLALPHEAVPSQEFLTLEPNFFADGSNLMAFLTFRTQTVTSLLQRVAGEVKRAELCFCKPAAKRELVAVWRGFTGHQPQLRQCAALQLR